MANRPVFVSSASGKFCVRESVEFTWFGGFALSQTRKCIRSLHESYLMRHPDGRILEISSKSEEPLGVRLSAFNLIIHAEDGRSFSIESAFQAGKKFERGGPYIDLLDVSSRKAKKDDRLKSSGRVIGFSFGDVEFPINPPTYFYNWLYINALYTHKELAEAVLAYDAFTDIVYNPAKSLNCQAEAAAIFVSLYKQGRLEQSLSDERAFLRIVYPNA